MPYMGSYNIQVLSYAYNALSWGCAGLFFLLFFGCCRDNMAFQSPFLTKKR